MLELKDATQALVDTLLSDDPVVYGFCYGIESLHGIAVNA